MRDISSERRQPALRIRVPAGGNSGQAISITIDPNESGISTNSFPAKEWSIDDNVLNISDSASVSIANPEGENSDKFYIGQRIEIDEKDPDVSNDWVRCFTGRITAIDIGSDLGGGSSIMLTAMDLGWHLTSCHAKPLQSTNGITLQKLLEKLIEPSWGFASTVVSGVPDIELGNVLNRKLKQGRTGVSRAFVPPKTILPFIQVEPGQAAFDLLRTYAQREGLLLNVGARGQLILFRPLYDEESPYQGIEYHPMSSPLRNRNNVEGRVTYRRTIDAVYSETQCWSTVVTPNKVQSAEIQNNPNAQYRRNTHKPQTNPLPFQRRQIVMDSEAINETMRERRARWNHQMGEFNSMTYECDVRGHSQSGSFFTSDSLIPVRDTVNKLPEGLYYVQAVRKSYTEQSGPMTHFTLKRPGLLDPDLEAQVGGGAKIPARTPAAAS